MTLNNIVPAECCIVQDIIIDGVLGQRLMDLGFYPGAKIRVVRNAPLVDPVEIELEGYHVSLRHEEASMVEVIKV